MSTLYALLAFVCVSSIWASSLPPVPIRTLGKSPRFVPGGRIVNGEEAVLGQFPWQVAIFGRSVEEPRYLCGGALISDEWVLTAGHCVIGALSADIYSGMAKISDPDRTISRASQFLLHEDYDPWNLNNDIGLIRLADPVTLDNNTRAIALAEEELEGGTAVTISGFGMVGDDDQNPYSDTLNYIDVTTVDNGYCASIFGSEVVYDGLVCTAPGDPLRSPCLGDSGAPVVANVDSDPVHVAVFSFVNGVGCELAYPAGNSRTAFFREWIRNVTGI